MRKVNTFRVSNAWSCSLSVFYSAESEHGKWDGIRQYLCEIATKFEKNKLGEIRPFTLSFHEKKTKIKIYHATVALSVPKDEKIIFKGA